MANVSAYLLDMACPHPHCFNAFSFGAISSHDFCVTGPLTPSIVLLGHCGAPKKMGKDKEIIGYLFSFIFLFPFSSVNMFSLYVFLSFIFPGELRRLNSGPHSC